MPDHLCCNNNRNGIDCIVAEARQKRNIEESAQKCPSSALADTGDCFILPATSDYIILHPVVTDALLYKDWHPLLVYDTWVLKLKRLESTNIWS